MIHVIQLGVVDYATGLRLQQKLVDRRKEGRIGDVLLLLEHTPVITLGRNAKTTNILASPEQLSQRGVEVFECDRGGDVTFHGPGQLVGYPIFDLRGFVAENGKRRTLGVIEYLRRLEEVLIRTCADVRISTMRMKGLTGVWTAAENEASNQTPGKIAAIGLHVSRGVTSHGFALNVNTDLSFFDLIIPCGIGTLPVTSMQRERNASLSMQDVAHSVARNVGSVFQSQILYLESLESLLGETVGVPVKEPPELRQLRGQDEIFWS